MPDTMTRGSLPATAAGADRDRLVTENLPLVGYLVAEVAIRLPSHVALDELRSAGFAALVQAADGFDPSRGVPFSRFASMRIRGALIDELRSQDWASRSVRAKARRRDEIEDELAATLGRRPTAEELAARLGVSVAELHAVDDDLHRAVVLSIQGFESGEAVDGMVSRHEPSPEDAVLTQERTAYLVDAVSELPDRLREVVVGLYFEERSIADVAADLGVTESRISQMRTEALRLLRDGMNSALDPDRLAAEARPGGRVARRREAYFAAIATRSDFRARVSGAATLRRGVA